jgi:hypothetical protein
MLFMVLRQAATGGNSGNISTDVFNNPFINADVGQRLATVFLYLAVIPTKNILAHKPCL